MKTLIKIMLSGAFIISSITTGLLVGSNNASHSNYQSNGDKVKFVFRNLTGAAPTGSWKKAWGSFKVQENTNPLSNTTVYNCPVKGDADYIANGVPRGKTGSPQFSVVSMGSVYGTKIGNNNKYNFSYDYSKDLGNGLKGAYIFPYTETYSDSTGLTMIWFQTPIRM